MQPPNTRPLIPIWIWLLAGFGIPLIIIFAVKSTPLGKVSFDIQRNEAALQAAAFLGQQSANPDDYWSTTSFQFNTNAQTYIYRETDRETLNQQAEQDHDLAHWRVRFWKELDPEQWEVEISSKTGRILGYNHIIADELPSASLTITEAQQLAITAVPANLELLTQSSITQPERTDHTFVWRDPAITLGEAQYRYLVRIQGTQIASVNEYYWLPESWWRESAWQARRGRLLAIICWAITYALTILIAFTWLQEVQRGRIRYRWAWRLWLAVCIVGILVMFNSIPLELDAYTTTQSLSSFLFGRFLSYMGQLVTITTTIVFAGMVGEALVWQSSKGALHMGQTLTKAGLRSRPVVQALLIGVLVGIAQLGIVSVFYAFGQKFGVWSPLTSLYDDTLSTPFPPLYGLALGLLPAVGEELLFRLGAITVLTRWIGKPKFAVVFTAIVWAALHSTYPQRPFFIRMLELSFIGILFGYLFIKYGVLASIAAHFTYNASLYVPLFWGNSVIFLIVSILVSAAALLLLIPALLHIIRGHQLLPDEIVAAPLPEPLPLVKIRPPTAITYQSLRRILIGIGLGIIALSIVGWNQPPTQVRTTTADTAIIAAQAATPSTINLAGLYPSSRAVADWFDLDLRYLHDTQTQAAIKDTVAQGHQRSWIVRWSSWDRPDSWQVELDPTNTIKAFQYTIPEDQPGAVLDLAQARALAQQTFTEYTTNPDDYELINQTTSNRTNRNDHSFTWQTKQPQIGQAYQRIDIDVYGDQVSRLSPSMYTPPEYRRNREQQTFFTYLQNNLASIITWIASTAIAILGLIGIARRKIAIHPWAWLGFAVGIMKLILEILKFRQGQWHETTRLLEALSSAISTSVFTGGEIALLAAGAAWAWLWWSQTPDQDLSNLLYRPQPAPKQTLVLILLTIISNLIINNLNLWPNSKTGVWASATLIDLWIPSIATLISAAITATNVTLLIIGSLGLLYQLLGKKRPISITLTSLGLAIALINIQTGLDIGIVLLTTGLIFILFSTYHIQPQAIWIGVWLSLLIQPILNLIKSGPGWYTFHGIISIIIAALAVCIMITRQTTINTPEKQQIRT